MNTPHSLKKSRVNNPYGISDYDHSIITHIFNIKKESDYFLSTNFKANLTPIQIEVLAILLHYPEVNTCTTLAQFLRVTKANITGVVKFLESKKLIKRLQDPDDLRVKHLSLTSKGIKTVDRVFPNYLDIMSNALNSIPPKDKEIIVNSLNLLYETLIEFNID